MSAKRVRNHEPFHEVRLSGAAPVLLLPQTTRTAGVGKALHTHPEGQFYFATQGLMVVDTAHGRSVMPPGRLGWIPPLLAHGATVIGSRRADEPEAVVGYTLYLLPELCDQFPAEPTVLGLTEVMHAILTRMQQWPRQGALSEREQRMLGVFIDEIHGARAEPLHLKMPVTKGLAVLATAIVSDPADETSLDEWAGRLGMSRRSITRHFRAETGMSVVEWRQVARLQWGLQLLGEGESVTSVAITLGYESVSSFIALFKGVLGVTPGRYLVE